MVTWFKHILGINDCVQLGYTGSLINCLRSVQMQEKQASTNDYVRCFYSDDCLKSSREDLNAVVCFEEGEEVAQYIGAEKYIETSAIEQSGFTDCFHTAVSTHVTYLGFVAALTFR